MMGSKVIKAALGLTALLLVIVLTACTSAQQATTPTTPQPTPPPSKSTALPPLESKPGTTRPQQAAAASSTPVSKVSGLGNIAVPNDARLTFSTGGKVAKIAVKQGDKVTKGTVLARLDTASLEVALVQAKVALDQAKLAQTQAEASLETANFTFDKTKAASDIKDEITNLQWEIKIGEMRMEEAQSTNDSVGVNYWRTHINNSRANLNRRTQDLATLLTKPEYTGTGALTYDIMGQKYDRLTLEDMRVKWLQVEASQQTLDKAQDSIELAQKNLDLAQRQLDDATITAPFDGVVATADVKEGDYVPAPSASQRPIVYLVDPTTMELNIGVNELDVPKIKVGQKAVIILDAFPANKLEGKVAAISPVPGTQGKIVDYEVKIAFTVPSTIEIRVGMSATAEIALE